MQFGRDLYVKLLRTTGIFLFYFISVFIQFVPSSDGENRLLTKHHSMEIFNSEDRLLAPYIPKPCTLLYNYHI